MSLISKTISNLIGGISQQEATIRLEGQCEDSLNGITSLVEGWKKRKGTRHIKKLFSVADCSDMNFHGTDDFLCTIKQGVIKVFALDGTEKTVTTANGTDTTYLDAVNNPKLKMTTVADTTFILNPATPAAMAGDTASNAYAGHTIIHVKQVNWDTTYKIMNSAGTVLATLTAPDGSVDPNIKSDDPTYADEQDDADPKWMDFNYIASALAAQITGAQAVKHCILMPAGTYKVSDTANGQYLIAIKDSVAAFSDLPIVAPNGFTVEITSSNSSSSGNYWVKAVTKDGMAFSDCYWQETCAPSLPIKIDPATMPHILMRNGSSFTYKQADWDRRDVGDNITNPLPTFIGKGINNVFYYKNRLGLLTDENAALSRASEPFAFFYSTVQTLADNECIDVAASNPKITYLKHAIPLSERLYFFSDTAQFLLNEGDSILSPKTASIDTLTEYACL